MRLGVISKKTKARRLNFGQVQDRILNYALSFMVALFEYMQALVSLFTSWHGMASTLYMT